MLCPQRCSVRSVVAKMSGLRRCAWQGFQSVLCPIDTMTGRTVFINGLLAEVFRDFPQL